MSFEALKSLRIRLLTWKIQIRQKGMDVPMAVFTRPVWLLRIPPDMANDIRNPGLGNSVTSHRTTTEGEKLFLMYMDYSFIFLRGV